MRKMLTATIVAMVLFAVGAFAASFALQADDVASGADEVQSCATEVNVAFNTPDPDDLVFLATGATLEYTEISAGACSGADAIVRLELTDENDAVTYLEVFDGELPTSGGTIDFTDDIPVEEITGVSVLIDGVEVS